MSAKNDKAAKTSETSGRTERFNATVKVGGKSYAPGRPVPVGGKSGLSVEEAENLRHNFGDFLGGPEVDSAAGVALNDAEISARDARIETLEAEKRELETRLQEKTDLYDKLVIDHTALGEDNITLANRVTAVEGELAEAKKPK